METVSDTLITLLNLEEADITSSNQLVKPTLSRKPKKFRMHKIVEDG